MIFRNRYMQLIFTTFQNNNNAIMIPAGKRKRSSNEKKHLIRNILTFTSLDGHEAKFGPLIEELMLHTNPNSAFCPEFSLSQ